MKTYIVEIELSNGSFFKRMSEVQHKAIQLLPYEERYDFLATLPDANISSTNDVDFYVDATGNRTAEQFWKEDGDSTWFS